MSIMVSRLHHGQKRGNCLRTVPGRTFVFVFPPHFGQQRKPFSFTLTFSSCFPRFSFADMKLPYESRFADFSPSVDGFKFARRDFAASLSSSVYSRFALNGLCPSRKGYSGQLSALHNLTALLLPQQQSRHFIRIDFSGVCFFWPVIIHPFSRCKPPLFGAAYSHSSQGLYSPL